MRCFFSRGMDDLPVALVQRREREVAAALNAIGIELVNPYNVALPRNKIASIADIVQEDTDLLRRSDFVLADLSIPNRSYIGAIFELARAAQDGKEIYVWTGDSGNHRRFWLKYYANGICRSLHDACDLIEAALTSQGAAANRSEAVAYYSAIAKSYELAAGTAVRATDDSLDWRQVTKREDNRLLREWIDGLVPTGTVVDLGSGTGRWSRVWSRSAKRVICVDASSEMLAVSSEASGQEIEHVEADILDLAWLRRFISGPARPDVLVMAFFLNTLTFEQERQILDVLRLSVERGTLLIIFENQSSVFSDPETFSRSELQRRQAGERTFRLYKRNFLLSDVERVLGGWGDTLSLFKTDNYYVGGIARRA